MFSNGGPDADAAEESVYERVLGEDFATLDPRLRAYFGPIPRGLEGFGSGRYSSAGLRIRALRPLFAVLGWRHIAFAEYGEDVPLTVRNVARPDGTLRAIRTFQFGNVTRTMTDTMRVSGRQLVDRIGINGELEVDLALHASEGGLRMESGRLRLRFFGIRLPLPRVVTVTLREEARGDGTQSVDVRIRAPLLGEVYGYCGAFTYSLEAIA